MKLDYNFKREEKTQMNHLHSVYALITRTWIKRKCCFYGIKWKEWILMQTKSSSEWTFIINLLFAAFIFLSEAKVQCLTPFKCIGISILSSRHLVPRKNGAWITDMHEHWHQKSDRLKQCKPVLHHQNAIISLFANELLGFALKIDPVSNFPYLGVVQCIKNWIEV